MGETQRAASTGSVLIADDDALIRMTLKMVAERQGFSVVDVPDGDRMIERLENARFDLCIMDVSMGGMGLHERMVRIKALDPEMRVVVLSGSVGAPDAVDGALFVSKPIDLAALKALLDDVPRRE